MQLVASAGRVEAEAEAGHVYGPEATPPRYNAFTTALLVDCSVNKAVEGGECPGLIQIITGRFRESGKTQRNLSLILSTSRALPVETRVALCPPPIDRGLPACESERGQNV